MLQLQLSSRYEVGRRAASQAEHGLLRFTLCLIPLNSKSVDRVEHGK